MKALSQKFAEITRIIALLWKILKLQPCVSYAINKMKCAAWKRVKRGATKHMCGPVRVIW